MLVLGLLPALEQEALSQQEGQSPEGRQPGGVCLAALVSRGPEAKGLCLRASLYFSMCISPCSDQVESVGAWKKLL